MKKKRQEERRRRRKARRRARRPGREVPEGGDLCILRADSLAEWQKPTQCHKAIIFQFLKNVRKKERKARKTELQTLIDDQNKTKHHQKQKPSEISLV